MKKKENKKQIDAEINRVLLSDFDKIENFVVSRWKQMFIGAGVIIVFVAIAYGIMLKKENNELAAQSAIANAATKHHRPTPIGATERRIRDEAPARACAKPPDDHPTQPWVSILRCCPG